MAVGLCLVVAGRIRPRALLDFGLSVVFVEFWAILGIVLSAYLRRMVFV